MKLADIKVMKKELELNILDLINDFNTLSPMKVEQVNINTSVYRTDLGERVVSLSGVVVKLEDI